MSSACGIAPTKINKKRKIMFNFYVLLWACYFMNFQTKLTTTSTLDWHSVNSLSDDIGEVEILLVIKKCTNKKT